MVYSGRKIMCSFFHGKEKIIECFYGFIDTDYIASDFISLRKDSPKKVIDQRKQYKHETSGEKRKEGGVARLAEAFGGKSACFSVFLSCFE